MTFSFKLNNKNLFFNVFLWHDVNVIICVIPKDNKIFMLSSLLVIWLLLWFNNIVLLIEFPFALFVSVLIIKLFSTLFELLWDIFEFELIFE